MENLQLIVQTLFNNVLQLLNIEFLGLGFSFLDFFIGVLVVTFSIRIFKQIFSLSSDSGFSTGEGGNSSKIKINERVK